jgi:hypothetical protein
LDVGIEISEIINVEKQCVDLMGNVAKDNEQNLFTHLVAADY